MVPLLTEPDDRADSAFGFSQTWWRSSRRPLRLRGQISRPFLDTVRLIFVPDGRIGSFTVLFRQYRTPVRHTTQPRPPDPNPDLVDPKPPTIYDPKKRPHQHTCPSVM